MSKKRRQHARTGTGKAANPPEQYYEELLGDLWRALRSGGLLDAERETARVATAMGELHDEADGILVDLASHTRQPEDAALLRLLVVLGSPAMKRKASAGLAELTADGIYPPEWVQEAGKATPLRAWRRYCQFGDWERIIVLFRYAEEEHILSVLADLAALPQITDIDLLTGVDDPAAEVARTTKAFEQYAEIGLGEARWRIEEPLRRGVRAASSGARYLEPILRSRLRRFPAAEPARTPAYTAADRAAAVAEFLGSTEAAGAFAADEAATRFWAEVLTGYSSRVPGVSPAQAGPRALATMLHLHVPEYLELTDAQRRHLRPAVTAWTRWSAAYRGLPEEAAAHLAAGLDGAFDGLDETYDQDFWTETRRYVADVITSDADLAWLRDVMERRHTAVLASWERDDEDEQTAGLDTSTADGRRAYAAWEFAECTLPAGMTRAEFTAGAHRVIEELWLGDPPETWERARKLLDTHDRHDVIHELERHARNRG